MSRTVKRLGATAAALVAIITLVPAPTASARPEPQPTPKPRHSCPLERIDGQLVRCDNLTGNGAAAPHWIPEQRSAR